MLQADANLLLLSDDQSDSDNSEMSAESAGGTIDWDIPMKLPRSVLLAARQARAAQNAATHSVRSPGCTRRQPAASRLYSVQLPLHACCHGVTCASVPSYVA